MICFTPSLDSGNAERALALLVKPRLDPLLFAGRIRGMQRMFFAYSAFGPPPWVAPGLHVTPEITYQSELRLPLDHLRIHFNALYRWSLTYPPILSSTPFAHGTSWAAIVAAFPDFLWAHTNPAALLEELVADEGLRRRFLFWSFMPGRFYGGGSDRYPAQSAIITEWFRRRGRHGSKLRCLDAACGDGGATYALARLCADHFSLPDNLDIEGWTLEPLEAWAAAHSRFPHDPSRERLFRGEAAGCFERGLDAAIRFCCANILHVPESDAFDLILCNGLLGGPIIHDHEDVDTAVRNLTALLAPGGMLLVEDHFHGGWKQRCPQQELRALCERYGLLIVKSAEGIYALKPDQ